MKNIIMLWIASGIFTLSFAQEQADSTALSYIQFERESPKDKTTWGVSAGVNYNNLFGKELDYIFANKQTDYKLGFHAGVFVNSPLGKGFGFRNELLFSLRRAGVYLSDEDEKEYSANFSRSYIDLMPFNLSFEKGGFQVYAGPYVSSLLSAYVNRQGEDGKIYKDKSIYGDPENEETESRYLQKFDFGVNVGFGYRFGDKFRVGLRYMHGFTDIFQYANSYTNEDTKTNSIKIFNRGFNLTCGFNF